MWLRRTARGTWGLTSTHVVCVCALLTFDTQEINKLSREALAMAFGAVIVRHRDPAEIRNNIQRLPTVVMKLMCLNWAKGSGVL